MKQARPSSRTRGSAPLFSRQTLMPFIALALGLASLGLAAYFENFRKESSLLMLFAASGGAFISALLLTRPRRWLPGFGSVMLTILWGFVLLYSILNTIQSAALDSAWILPFGILAALMIFFAFRQMGRRMAWLPCMSLVILSAVFLAFMFTKGPLALPEDAASSNPALAEKDPLRETAIASMGRNWTMGMGVGVLDRRNAAIEGRENATNALPLAFVPDTFRDSLAPKAGADTAEGHVPGSVFLPAWSSRVTDATSLIVLIVELGIWGVGLFISLILLIHLRMFYLLWPRGYARLFGMAFWLVLFELLLALLFLGNTAFYHPFSFLLLAAIMGLALGLSEKGNPVEPNEAAPEIHEEEPEPKPGLFRGLSFGRENPAPKKSRQTAKAGGPISWPAYHRPDWLLAGGIAGIVMILTLWTGLFRIGGGMIAEANISRDDRASIDRLRLAVRLHPFSAEGRLKLAEGMSRHAPVQWASEILDAYRAAEKMAPWKAETYAGQARHHKSVNEYFEMRFILDEGKGILPQSPLLSLWEVELARLTNNGSLQIRALEDVIRLLPPGRDELRMQLMRNLAELQEKKGQLQAALETWSRFFQMRPTDTEARRTIDRLAARIYHGPTSSRNF
ncbi:MAG: tetratricopeptide repeat protein [Candidatus Sumerlaeia bacterium]